MAKFATSVEGVEEILRGFTRLSKGVQRKYLGSSVREVVKAAVPEVKALTPKGPTGNLRRSVGLKLEKKKTTTAVGIVGYRSNSKANRKNTELGFHAFWTEQGTKDRYPKSGTALKIPMRYARKYNYLKGKMAASQQAAADLGGADGGAIFFRSVRGYTGSGKFQRWAEQNLPRMKEQLVGKLEANLSKAIAEEERRIIRRKYGKK
jgi:hypothetical protein